MLIDYLTLRKLIGYIALGLPFSLMIGAAITQPGPLPASISDYFYTSMGRVLVGALCAIGVFLTTYRGYGAGDFLAMKIMAVAAIGVAWCPTIPANPSHSDNVVGIFHGIFAATMFVTMTVTCLFLFTRSSKAPSSRPKRKRQRNTVYRVCGILMAVLLIAIYPLTHMAALVRYLPMFCLESAIIMTFGFAWSVKGQAFLPDDKVRIKGGSDWQTRSV